MPELHRVELTDSPTALTGLDDSSWYAAQVEQLVPAGTMNPAVKATCSASLPETDSASMQFRRLQLFEFRKEAGEEVYLWMVGASAATVVYNEIEA